MNTKEYFMAHAPTDIPDWFVHNPVGIQPIFPSWTNLHDEDRKTVKGWISDGIFDLPDHLKWFEEKYNKVLQLKRQYDYENTIERYFQWRIYYAEQLLKREK
jgi:hypothetical protein